MVYAVLRNYIPFIFVLISFLTPFSTLPAIDYFSSERGNIRARLMALELLQYGRGYYRWSNQLDDFPTHKENPFIIPLERTLHGDWSINLGYGYNIILSKDKQSLRGKGMKLGLAYWF